MSDRRDLRLVQRMASSVMTVLRCLWLTALAAVLACAVQAQAVRVELRDSTSGEPVVGALVSATDSTGARRADGLSNERGVVTLRLPAAGLWVIGIRRIGLTPRQMPAIRVAAGAVVSMPLAVTSMRQMLSRVRVTARAGSCGRAPVGEDRAAMLWEQITLALRASTLSRADTASTSKFRVRERVRELSASLDELSANLTRVGYGMGRAFAAAPPESLAASGYVKREPEGDLSFFAPDETVLLSPSFLATHCFETPKRDANPALAELRFKPVRGRTVADVEGTAFVDTLSGELRRIEFRFVASRALLPLNAKHAGGDVVLRRLPNGLWIVSEWAIRMPVFLVGGMPTRVYLNGYREVGGSVDAVAAPPPQPPPAPPSSPPVRPPVRD